MLRLAPPPPTIPALEREIAEVEERLFALRAKLASLTSPRQTRSEGPRTPVLVTAAGKRPQKGKRR
jgi:hypothetical protein